MDLGATVFVWLLISVHIKGSQSAPLSISYALGEDDYEFVIVEPSLFSRLSELTLNAARHVSDYVRARMRRAQESVVIGIQKLDWKSLVVKFFKAWGEWIIETVASEVLQEEMATPREVADRSGCHSMLKNKS